MGNTRRPVGKVTPWWKWIILGQFCRLFFWGLLYFHEFISNFSMGTIQKLKVTLSSLNSYISKCTNQREILPPTFNNGSIFSLFSMTRHRLSFSRELTNIGRRKCLKSQEILMEMFYKTLTFSTGTFLS